MPAFFPIPKLSNRRAMPYAIGFSPFRANLNAECLHFFPFKRHKEALLILSRRGERKQELPFLLSIISLILGNKKVGSG
jgi:hypothetical protein